MLAAIFACVVAFSSPVQSTTYGITAPFGSEVAYFQRACEPFPAQNASVLLEEWCLHDEHDVLSNCGAGICDGCWPRQTAFITGPYQAVRSAEGVPMRFVVTLPDDRQVVGDWLGPADVTQDGVIDSRDFFEFVEEWFAGSDFNFDGVSDSQDLYDFIEAFLSNA